MTERAKELLEGVATMIVGIPLGLAAVLLMMMIVEDMRLTT